MEKPKTKAPAIVQESELRDNVGPYLDMAVNGREVIVTRDGREVVRLLPRGVVVSFLTDALTGILSEDVDADQAREEYLREKYALTR